MQNNKECVWKMCTPVEHTFSLQLQIKLF